MNAKTRATQAVLSAYARKVLRPIEIVASIVFAIALAGTAYLIANLSAWWWLLMIVVLLYGLLGSILWLVLHYTLDRITPDQTSYQKRAVAKFIARTETVANSLNISQFGLLLRITHDVFHKNTERNVLTEFAKDSSNLREAFKEVIEAFDSRHDMVQ